MHRLSIVLACCFAVTACDGDDAPTDETDGGGASSGVVSSDDSGGMTSGSPTSGNGPTTAAPTTDSAGDTSGNGVTTDDPTTDPSGDSGETDAETSGDTTQGETTGDPGRTGGGTIDVTLSGCDVDLGGTVVVSYNGSIGVASVYDNGASLTGSFQFDLQGEGTMQLSTQHRVDTMNIINLTDIGQGTWTNLDDDALSGGVDSIAGTLTVTTWNPSAGEVELEFDGVSLMNLGNGNVCTIDGSITTTELYP